MSNYKPWWTDNSMSCKGEFIFVWNVSEDARMDLRRASFSPSKCLSESHVCVHLCFSHSFLRCTCVCVQVFVTCWPVERSAWRGEAGGGRGCAEQVYPHMQTHPDFVGASSVMGSGRWSTAARCTATWSVGSAWLECHPSEPWGPQNLAPKQSLPHTPPKNTQAHAHAKSRLIHC